ncbi:MAG TPA: hypothetical protein VF796_08225 [Humisphaera sp.]
MTPPPAHAADPYAVEQIYTESGPAWRLVGPGLVDAKAYPWAEVREKLAELAAVMNFAWRQARATSGGNGHADGHAGQTRAAGTDARPYVIDPAANCSPHTPCDPAVAQQPASLEGEDEAA